MRPSRRFLRLFSMLSLPIALVTSMSASVNAADPGLPFPANSPASDQRLGSILVYNVYTSSITNFNGQNSRMTLTNASETSFAYVHLFFVDGATCSVADSYICLTPNQTVSILASDLDPGITGFMVVVAVDQRGCPTRHNFLLGDAYVKFPTGHSGNIAAEAFAAQYDTFVGCNESSSIATLYFAAPGTPDSYNFLPRTVMISNIPDRGSDNNTLMILNRLGGNLGIGASGIGSVFGILYDDAENAFSFTFTSGACQFRSILSNNFPRTAPRFDTIIPAGRSGWIKLSADNPAVGLVGVTFNSNMSNNAAPNAFNGAHNMHHLTLNNTGGGAVSITIPVFPPSC